MNTVKTYLRKWNLLRTLQFAIGIFIMLDGLHYGQWPVAVVGAIVAILPVFNVGCRKSACCRADFDVEEQRKI
jgi:hypothetical protein